MFYLTDYNFEYNKELATAKFRVLLATNSGLGNLRNGFGEKIRGEKWDILISFLFTRVLLGWDAYHFSLSHWGVYNKHLTKQKKIMAM